VVDFYGSTDEIIPVEDLDRTMKTVMVFDDVMLEKQGPIEKYFSQGRHGGADSFYLCQSYFRIPKQVIRENANLIVLFDQDNKNIQQIHNTFVNGDMDIGQFRSFFKECVSRPYDFCVIDLTSSVDNGRYRHGFDKFYFPHH